MALEIIGKLIRKLEVQSGTSEKNNENRQWTRQDILIEVPGQYPKTICVSLWGEQVAEIEKYNIGDILKINFDLQSREFNGRWYTSVRPWRIELEAISATAAGTAANVPATGAAADAPASSEPAAPVAGEDPFASPSTPQTVDDLPF